MPDGPSKQQPPKATASTRKQPEEEVTVGRDVPPVEPPAPEPEPVPEPAPDAFPPLPEAPQIPTHWTPATIVTYAASLVTFMIGLLTMSGVTIPNSVSSGVQLWAGAAVTLAGPVITLVVYLAKVSFAKTAVQQGVPVHHAAKLA